MSSTQSCFARSGSHSRNVRQNDQHHAHGRPYSDKVGSQFYHHSQAPMSPRDTGHYLGSSREMGPPPFPSDYSSPPQPIEIEINSRTLPTPSVSSYTFWSDISSPGIGGLPDYGSGRPLPMDNQARTTAPDPLQQWYAGNDGPWIPKNISTVPDARLPISKPRVGNRMPMPYGVQYRQPNHLDTGSFQYGVPPSDSGYGTRHSDGNASIFSADINDRDQDCQSLVGHVADYHPFQGLNNETVQQRDNRLTDAWDPIPSSSASLPTPLICHICKKTVKTRSELKKHDLRHRKPFVCNYGGCARTEGFSTINDLDRHTKSKHPSAIPQSKPTKSYRCHVQGCKAGEKSWPRLDNFRSHLKRMHFPGLEPEDVVEDMIRRAEFWEQTGLAISSDDVSSQNPSIPNPSQASGPVALNVSSMAGNVEADWKPMSAYPEVVLPTHDSMDPKESTLEDHSKAYTPDCNVPALTVERRETVQPQDVFQPPTEIRNSPSFLDSLLAPVVATGSEIKNTDQETTQPAVHISKAVAQGKIPRPKEEPASDATLTEAIVRVLVGSTTPKSTRDCSLQEGLRRDNLPDGQTSPKGPNPEHLANSSGKPLCNINNTSSPAGQEDSISLQQKKAQEVLRSIQELGYIVQRAPSYSPKPRNQGSAASYKSDHLVTCPTCKRFSGRPCELTKHMKRHSRPYGCTFLDCRKSFGSKNDWKRHENSQHFHLETWRCDVDKVEGGACAKACYRRQIFQEHLRKEHQISDPDAVKDRVEACHLGRNCQDRFWCGFCYKTIDLTKNGVGAWTERFDHIDDHFMGRNNLAKKGIQDWIPVHGDKAEEEALEMSPRKVSQDSPSDESSSASPMENSPEPSGVAGGSQLDAINLDEACDIRSKRARSSSSSSSSDESRPKKQRKTTTYGRNDTTIYCCHCEMPNNPKISETCVMCDGNHPLCTNCVVEVIPAGQDEGP